jgi:hypothetical protein
MLFTAAIMLAAVNKISTRVARTPVGATAAASPSSAAGASKNGSSHRSVGVLRV